MNTIIQEIIAAVTENFEKELRQLAEGNDISGFIKGMKQTLDGVGARLVAEALERLNQAYREDKRRKKNWLIKSKADSNTLATVFGEVKYARTYFEHRKTGEYAYLSDESVGIKPYDKMDTLLKARLVDEAHDIAYRKSGEKAVEALSLSSQTVMNSIREMGPIPNDAVKVEEKRTVKLLYIEADEDHVANQSGNCIEPKIVYVHEGKRQIGKNRFSLINPRYFSGVYPRSEDLWLEVANYIEAAYETTKINKIYLSGDGAQWIQSGTTWITNSVFVLDRYHLSKYVKLATAHMSHTTALMWRYINNGDKSNLKKLFAAIYEATDSNAKRETILTARSYILGNFKAIQCQYEEDYIGCSAEGHVSHILSDRLSSRPLGWSKEGTDQMARLRAFKANGGNVYDFMMEKKRREERVARDVKIDRCILQKRSLVGEMETVGNLALLNYGKKTGLSLIIKHLRDH